ncbi:MAG TPA: DUF3500 domain-containing protein [Bryobacteraceae bacterium]|nr:DUF3500 domain-containing protein [Bryobacteraceae bacterium]HTF67089.1 DUF3500 domain-containing protein [Edaphobacter sp.]
MSRINRRSLFTSAVALAGTGLLAHKHAGADQPHVHNGSLVSGSAHHPVSSSSLLKETANRFLAALGPEQRAKTTFKFEDNERMNWHFIPKERKGLPLREMTPIQKHLASALLSAGLGQTGYIKAVTIMSLEDVLKVIENDSGERRNPEKYYFSIFGTPSDTDPWGYRVEGHHISQNYTVADGKVIDAPSFFGANPAEVRDGPRKGLRTLAAEDDLGLDLIQSLDLPQRKIAIVDPTAYKDILTAANRKAALEGQPSGLSASKMNGKQFDALMALLQEYARNVPQQLAEQRQEQARKAGRDILFAWSGGINHGDPHYYRVQAPSFLIEFDDTQDGANHIHAVWRDFSGDFGEDLLKLHYQTSHLGQ